MFLFGLMLGGVLGMLIMCLFIAGKRNEDEYINEFNRKEK